MSTCTATTGSKTSSVKVSIIEMDSAVELRANANDGSADGGHNSALVRAGAVNAKGREPKRLGAVTGG